MGALLAPAELHCARGVNVLAGVWAVSLACFSGAEVEIGKEVFRYCLVKNEWINS